MSARLPAARTQQQHTWSTSCAESCWNIPRLNFLLCSSSAPLFSAADRERRLRTNEILQLSTASDSDMDCGGTGQMEDWTQNGGSPERPCPKKMDKQDFYECTSECTTFGWLTKISVNKFNFFMIFKLNCMYYYRGFFFNIVAKGGWSLPLHGIMYQSSHNVKRGNNMSKWRQVFKVDTKYLKSRIFRKKIVLGNLVKKIYTKYTGIL